MDWLCGELSEGAWEEERRDKASSLCLRGEHNTDLRFVLNSDNRDNRGKGRRRPLKVQPTAQSQQRLRSSAPHCFMLFFCHFSSHILINFCFLSVLTAQLLVQREPEASLAVMATRRRSANSPQQRASHPQHRNSVCAAGAAERCRATSCSELHRQTFVCSLSCNVGLPRLCPGRASLNLLH